MELNEDNLRKKYWQYIIPSIISQVVFTIYTMVDALMVARGVSPSALAGVNIASPYVTVLWAIAITFAVGTSTMVARLMGEGNDKVADRVFSQTCFVLLVFSVIFSVVTYMGAGVIGNFLGATDATREYTTTYIRTIAPFSLCFITSYLFEILMPIDGHPKLASIIVTVGVVSNCILDYIFIFIFNWGVWGAAFATGLSQLCVTALYLIHFLGSRSNIKFCKFAMDWKLIIQELWRGLPAGVAEVSPGMAVFIFVRFIGHYLGDDGLVAYSATGYISAILIIVAVAIGQGAQPIVSYYNGAKRQDLINRVLKYEFKDVAIISVCIFAAVFATAPLITRFFLPDETATLVAYATKAMRLFITFGLIDVYSIVLSQYATALEQPINGVLIAFLRTTVFLVAGILIMLKLMGPEGIWLGMTCSEVFTLALAITLTRRIKPSSQELN